MLFTDTDSLTYEITSEDNYEEFFKSKHLFDFDFSHFSKDSKFYDNQNEIVIGKMKVLNKGIPIDRFPRLKSKMYSILLDDGKESSRAKGVNIGTEFNEFRDTLFNNNKKKCSDTKWKEFRIKNKLGTCEINKISLSCFDDKRFVLNNGTHTLADFHKELRK